MRTSVASLGAIVMLLVGFIGLGELASDTESVAVTNGTNATADSFNMTTEVFGGLGQAASGGIVWMGVAAVILVALGFLVLAGSSGR